MPSSNRTTAAAHVRWTTPPGEREVAYPAGRTRSGASPAALRFAQNQWSTAPFGYVMTSSLGTYGLEQNAHTPA